jgi:hypothetical protein
MNPLVAKSFRQEASAHSIRESHRSYTPLVNIQPADSNGVAAIYVHSTIRLCFL